MKLRAVLSFLVVIVAASLSSRTSAETVQTPANVFNGRPFLYVEGESASTFTGTAWHHVEGRRKGRPGHVHYARGVGWHLSAHCASYLQCLRSRYLGSDE